MSRPLGSGAGADGHVSGPAEATKVVKNLRDEVKDITDEFLRVEKFANINLTACYKILKKHDKLVPETVCCRFYLRRLHAQPWMRANHSAVFVVKAGELHAKLRGEHDYDGAIVTAAATRGKTASQAHQQDFVRTTRKFWVRPTPTK